MNKPIYYHAIIIPHVQSLDTSFTIEANKITVLYM